MHARALISAFTCLMFSLSSVLATAKTTDARANKWAGRLMLQKIAQHGQNKQQFLEFIARLKDDDRKWTESAVAKLKSWPEVSVVNDALLLRDNGRTTTVRVTDYANLKLEINGRPFTLNPAAPVKDQAEAMQKLIGEKKTASGIKFQLFPEAHAVLPVVVIAGVVVVTAAGAIAALLTTLGAYASCHEFAKSDKTEEEKEALKGTSFDKNRNPLANESGMTWDDCFWDSFTIGDYAERVAGFECDRENGALVIPIQNVAEGDTGNYTIAFDTGSGAITQFKRVLKNKNPTAPKGEKIWALENGKVKTGQDATKPGSKVETKGWLNDPAIVDDGEALLPYMKTWVEMCRDQYADSAMLERLRRGNRPMITKPNDQMGTRKDGSNSAHPHARLARSRTKLSMSIGSTSTPEMLTLKVLNPSEKCFS
ncbi:MAG TPA: hypothetical protein VFV50_12130 [Bdellovibrionales bacterium]|nr:hypothetical protein [Bdellovibrionales bacterium]